MLEYGKLFWWASCKVRPRHPYMVVCDLSGMLVLNMPPEERRRAGGGLPSPAPCRLSPPPPPPPLLL
jgi:hypothetical protein